MTVAVLGEALIDLIAEGDGAFRPHLGGSPYNLAIGLARLGIPVAYISPLSDDSFGDRLQGSLRKEGVELPLDRRSRRPTSLALVVTDESGLPSYRLYREGVADKDIGFNEIRAVLPDRLEIFHTGSLALTPSQLGKIEKTLKHVRRRRVIVSIDINIRLGVSMNEQTYLAGVRSLLPLADIVKASEEDLEALAIETDIEKSAEAAFAEMGSGLFILTAGERGARIYFAEGKLEQKAWPIDRVADTIGAGDTFHSAFLAFLMRSGVASESLSGVKADTLASAMNAACAAAAINVSRAGCSPPTLAELDSYLRVVGQPGPHSV